MVLLSWHGSIVCSGSSHFIPKIGISIAWRCHVSRGSITFSNYSSHTLLALRFVWMFSCYASCYAMTVDVLASCDDIYWLLLCSYGGCMWLPPVDIDTYYVDDAYVDYGCLMLACCCLVLGVVGWYVSLDDDW